MVIDAQVESILTLAKHEKSLLERRQLASAHFTDGDCVAFVASSWKPC